MAGLFPRRPGSVGCRIGEGGPVTREVAGRCETHVALAGDGSAVVRFVERWDGRDFRGQGSPATPGLQHAWRFHGLADGASGRAAKQRRPPATVGEVADVHANGHWGQARALGGAKKQRELVAARTRVPAQAADG